MGCPHLTAYARVALARFSLLHSLHPADSQLAPDLDAAASAEGASASATTAVEVGPGAAAVHPRRPRWILPEITPSNATCFPDPVLPPPPPFQLQRALRHACSLAHASQLAAALPIEPSPAAPYSQEGAPPMQGALADNLYDAPAVFGRASRAAQQASALAARQLAGAAHSLAAASWQMHGAAGLAHTHALLQLMCGQASGRDEDLAVAWAQLVEVTAARRGACGGGCTAGALQRQGLCLGDWVASVLRLVCRVWLQSAALARCRAMP
jgi:anaphase-promoting complex subunit 5